MHVRVTVVFWRRAASDIRQRPVVRMPVSAFRWYAGGTIGVSIGPVYFFLRELVEQIYYTDRNLNVSGSVISYLRSRLRVEFRMESLPLTPFIGVENFLYLSDYSF